MPNILNAAPITYENATIQVETFTYSEEKQNELHDTCRNTHLIKRSADLIIAVPLRAGLEPIGGTIAQIDLEKELGIVRSLASHALQRELFNMDCWIYSTKPLTYLKTKQNILEECMVEGAVLVKGLAVFPKYEIEFRVIDPLGTGSFVSLNINVGTAPRISINCYDLMRNGISVIGFYVGKAYYGKNPELKPRFSSVGRVINVNSDGMLELEDIRDGEENIIDPTTLYLEPREDLLEYCIRCIYKENAPLILSNLESKLAQFHIGNSKLQKLTTALKGYQKFNLKLVDGHVFKIGNFLTDTASEVKHLKVFDAEKPLFVYAHGAAKTSQYNDPGLQTYGPFSREDFTPTKPHICVVFQASKKGQVEQVIHKFLNGIPPVPYGKNGKFFEFTGLKNKFRIKDCTLEYFPAADDSIESYNKAIGSALQAGGTTKPFDFALIQIDSNFRDRKPNENPYLAAKSRFIGQQIPVQEFTLESLTQPDARIVWSLNNMALATYAKLGGVPWLLTADAPMAHEVVIGIGSAMIYTSRLAAKQRMVGITTVFKGDGRYFVNNVSSAVLASEYFETLLTNLRTTIDRIKVDFNWRPKDTVRLIFHAFKTFADAEANAVKQLMKELGDYNVEYSFIHVAPNHPYVLFDDSQRGIFGKGVFAPPRARYLQISEHVSLVSLTGAQELKKPTDGLPQPVQLILHRDSTFKDMTYLSKQVIKFGAHSWRSFQPAPMPVSVYYSQLMAQMLSQLNGVSSWNPDAILNKIGTTRWFL